METGKVEYSSDYKCEKSDYTDGGRLPTIKEMSGLVNYGGRVVFENGEAVVLTKEESITHEHQRLKDAVVEAAKAETEAYDAPLTLDWCMAHWRTQKAVWLAVETLIAFEAEHKIGEDHA